MSATKPRTYKQHEELCACGAPAHRGREALGLCHACDVAATRARSERPELVEYTSASGRKFRFLAAPGNEDAARLLKKLIACGIAPKLTRAPRKPAPAPVFKAAPAVDAEAALSYALMRERVAALETVLHGVVSALEAARLDDDNDALLARISEALKRARAADVQP